MAIASTTPLIPKNVLFGNPDKSSPQISPDGKRLAYLAPLNGVLNIWVRTLGQQDDKPLTQDTDRGVRSYFWGHDGDRLFYVQDKGGNENWRLYSVSLTTKQLQDLTPYDHVQVRIIDTDKHFPTMLLLALNISDESLHDAYSLDLNTLELKMVAKNPGNISSWISNSKFQIRGAMVSRDDGSNDFIIRDSDTDAWRTLLSWSREDSMNSSVVGFSLDGSKVYLRQSKDIDTAGLFVMDIKMERATAIALDPEADAGGVMMHPDRHEPQAVVFNKSRLTYRVLDPSIRPDIQHIQAISTGDFFILSRDNADRLWIVAIEHDDSSLQYYLYDRSSQKHEFLFENRPQLSQYQLAPMEPITYKSRDGLTIHGYITFPVNGGRNNLPLVLNVHGGPWARDSWGYDAEAQWLANRGYICLQINYRGSTGYGKAFVNAGDKEWGGKMQDDMTDAVRWAIQKGYADQQRVAIYGGSYGGYAALAGATFTPELYRCAVAIVGPSNLLTFIRSIPPYWKVYQSDFYQRVGDPDKEEAFLRSRSPLFSVDRIQSPLLIAQGANDPRVKRAESEQIVQALEKKGLDHEYLLFEDEGHGFAKPANRIRFYTACERFLSKNLGGKCEADA